MTDILRKYLLSSVFRSPDEPAAAAPEGTEEPAAPEVAADDPPPAAAEPPAEPVAEPAAAAPAAPAPAPPASKDHGNKGKQPWYLGRISEAEHAKRKAQEEAAANKQRADDAEAMLARIQRGEQPAAPPAPARQPGQTPADFDKAVKDEAARQRVFEDTVAVRDTGLEKFPDFQESLNILTAIGVTSDAIVSDLIAVDRANAHVILDKLAKDQDKAAALVAMSPQRRIAEFTRMSMAEATPKAAEPAPKPAVPPSKAPVPPPRLAPVSARPEAADFSDEATDDDWSAAWDRKHLKAG